MSSTSALIAGEAVEDCLLEGEEEAAALRGDVLVGVDAAGDISKCGLPVEKLSVCGCVRVRERLRARKVGATCSRRRAATTGKMDRMLAVVLTPDSMKARCLRCCCERSRLVYCGRARRSMDPSE